MTTHRRQVKTTESHYALARKVAILLLSARPDELVPEQTHAIVSNLALDMAERIRLGYGDIPGKPYYNEQMALLRRSLAQRKKRRQR